MFFIFTRASVNVVQGNLYLLATLPDRQDPPTWRQERIRLKLQDTPANQRTARRRLPELEKQLAAGSFSWAFWVEDTSKVRPGGGVRHADRQAAGDVGVAPPAFHAAGDHAQRQQRQQPLPRPPAQRDRDSDR